MTYHQLKGDAAQIKLGQRALVARLHRAVVDEHDPALLQRAKRALVFGGSVAPAAIVQPMQLITRFDNYVQQVKRAYHCRNF